MPGKERLAAIVDVIERYEPDLLVTAGWALDVTDDLIALSSRMRGQRSATIVVAEIHRDAGPKDFPTRSHAMWAVLQPGCRLHRFGNQAFRTADESRSNWRQCMLKFRRHVGARTVEAMGQRLFALCCGEINVVVGRHDPRFVCAFAERAVMSADIIVNPTHDRMGNGGTLRAKRSFLSRQRDGRDRVYVSCSNWDVSGKNRGVQQPSLTLHTVYRSGLPLKYDEIADGSDGVVVRRWTIDR